VSAGVDPLLFDGEGEFLCCNGSAMRPHSDGATVLMVGEGGAQGP
jgi:hypothetical protein